MADKATTSTSVCDKKVDKNKKNLSVQDDLNRIGMTILTVALKVTVLVY